MSDALQKSMAIALFSVLLLTACGGGSDSNSSGNPSSVIPLKQPPIIESEPTPNVADDDSSTETDSTDTDIDNDAQAALVANNEIGIARTSCGLNGLSVDPELDKIAIQHANYIKHVYVNSTPSAFNPHYENKINNIADITGANNPFFRGSDFTDRLLSARYANLSYGVAENIAQIVYSNTAGNIDNIITPDFAAQAMAKSLLAAPYHLRSLMRPSSSVTGTGVVTYKPDAKNPDKNQGYILVNHAAATQATSNTRVEGIFTYPCQNVTGTVTALYNETPDPVKGTGRNLRDDPIGQPIYISMPSADSIKVSNIQFRDVKRNINVPIDLLDYDNDPYENTEYELPVNEAFILPLTDNLKSCETGPRKGQNCGLYGNSEYRVSFDVLIDNDTLESKQFSFTTGKVNY